MMRILCAVVVAASLAGCVKPPGEKEKTLEDYGPQITPEKLVAELNANAAPDPYEIRQGDEALLVRQQVIERETLTVNKTKSVVTKRDDLPDRIDYEWTTTYEEWKNEHPVDTPPTQKNYPGSIKKPATTAFGRVLDALTNTFGIRFSFFTESQAAPFNILQARQHQLHAFQGKLAPTAVKNTTFHNFTRENIKVRIPELAQKRKNCGRRNPEGCSIPIEAEKIQYDAVVWVDGKVDLKVSVLKVTSPELPYFYYETPEGPDLDWFYMSCSEGIIDIQTQKVHVIDCTSMKDMYLVPPPEPASL